MLSVERKQSAHSLGDKELLILRKLKLFNEATIQARNVSLQGAGETITAVIVSTIWKGKKPR
jgi:fructose-1-phosphate kinase PfkB-like protein